MRRNARRISTVAEEGQDVDLNPEREQVAVTVKNAGQLP